MLIEHNRNYGIPKSWNDLTKALIEKNCEIIVLFNDDIKVITDDWLDALVYFFENNEKVGMVGFPLIQINPQTGIRDTRYPLPEANAPPQKVGHAVGCCFAFRREAWESVTQPDNATGFWEDLVSFSEELDFGYELAKQGYQSYMLSYPAMEHWGSATFAKNKELLVREFSSYLPKEEYLNVLKDIKDIVCMSTSELREHHELAEKGKAQRMMYSNIMFAKKMELFWCL